MTAHNDLPPASDAPAPPRDADLPTADEMRGILKAWTRVGPESDAERIEMLIARGVVSVYFADGSQFNPGAMDLRAALDTLAASPAQEATPPREQELPLQIMDGHDWSHDYRTDEVRIGGIRAPRRDWIAALQRLGPAREASTAPGEETKWLDTVGAQRFLEEAAEACDLGKNPMIEAAEFRKLAATVAALTVAPEPLRALRTLLTGVVSYRTMPAALDEALTAVEATVAALTADRDHWKSLCNAIAGQHDRAMDGLTAERGARGQGQQQEQGG
jgi:hypothetical protein